VIIVEKLLFVPDVCLRAKVIIEEADIIIRPLSERLLLDRRLVAAELDTGGSLL
jgi:hypothetical protein